MGSEGDRMESEGPYSVKEENGVSNLYLHKLKLEGHTKMFLMDLKMLCEALNTAHCVGEKAERERCLEISKKHRENCVSVLGCADAIENEIRGGQDGE